MREVSLRDIKYAMAGFDFGLDSKEYYFRDTDTIQELIETNKQQKEEQNEKSDQRTDKWNVF